jgi:peptidoglycan/LPS O-acetylase OafA/YrhL
MAWLDALRGIAALCVVYAHFGVRVLPWLHTAIYTEFDPGLYGVLVFFLISGYIVPASLERRGCVRTFWISRLFRLFPLFALVIGIALLLHAFGMASLRGAANQSPTVSVLAHLFMLSDLLGQASILIVAWTLSYEMVFYLLVTALFTVRLHVRSGGLGVLFAGGALLLGGLLPTVWLSSSRSLGLTPVAVGADILIIGGLAVAAAARGLPRALGAWTAALTGLVLVVLNERKFAYEGLAILALMFTGTLLYRAQHGQIGRGRAGMAVAGIFAAVIAAGAWHIPTFFPGNPITIQRQWVLSVALAGLTFAAGLTLQRVRVPSSLAWLGLVSYSVYLVLPVLLDVYDASPFATADHDQAWLQAALAAGFVAALLACAAATHYLVEAPMQRLGRRVTARLDDRLGSGQTHAPLQPIRSAT